jgi:hypothetical protein
MGLNIYLRGIKEEAIFPKEFSGESWREFTAKQLRSNLYTEHTWTPIHISSSSSALGFNKVVGSLVGMNLYTIFYNSRKTGNEYRVSPNWEKASKDAETLLEMLVKKTQYSHEDLSWYIQAAEIIAKEFIPLGLKDKETSYLMWAEPFRIGERVTLRKSLFKIGDVSLEAATLAGREGRVVGLTKDGYYAVDFGRSCERIETKGNCLMQYRKAREKDYE